MKYLVIAASVLALAGCAGGLNVGVSGQAKKVGSKCYVKNSPDNYSAGHYRQVEDGTIVCVKD